LLSAIHFSLHTAQQASSVDEASSSPQREKMIDLSKAVKSFLPTSLSIDTSVVELEKIRLHLRIAASVGTYPNKYRYLGLC
jgi:hypothetical protein